jgi:hypothetical protein
MIINDDGPKKLPLDWRIAAWLLRRCARRHKVRRSWAIPAVHHIAFEIEKEIALREEKEIAEQSTRQVD